MHIAHQLLLQIHIAIGLIAIIAFWLPVATTKGSRLHRQSGRLYSWAMYAVSFSAFTMSVIVFFDPIGVRFPSRDLDPARAYEIAASSRMTAAFLLMLALLVFSSLRHGLLAPQTRRNPEALRSIGHRALVGALGIAGVVVGVIGLMNTQWLLIIFAALSIANCVGMTKDIRKAQMNRRESIIAHFQGLIGTGIGAYTALFAFGGSRLLAELLSGQWQIIPWIAPAVIGTIALRQFEKRFTPGVRS